MPRNVIFTKKPEAVEYAREIDGQLTEVEGGFTVDEVPQIYAHVGIAAYVHPHPHAGDPAAELSKAPESTIPPGATETAKKKKPTRTKPKIPAKTNIPEGFRGIF